MSNSIKRVLSAIVLIGTVIICVNIGVKTALCFLFLIGILINDEIFCNFFKKRRYSVLYFSNQLILAVPFSMVIFLPVNELLMSLLVKVAILFNILLLVYLFYVDMKSNLLLNLGNKYPLVSSIYILINLMALSSIFYLNDWAKYLAILLFVAAGMDSGAWIFGKNFGKHKLWPSVSPNKTIEGLIGGALTAGFLGTIFWNVFFSNSSILLFSMLCLLGIISQLGDLVQSKIKRQFALKDSSNLIPGHGGVYDRLDSLFFLAPFFAVAIKLFST